MNRKLFLSSSFGDVSELLPDFLGDLSNKRVTFIPTAAKVEKVNFFVKLGKKGFGKNGSCCGWAWVINSNSRRNKN